jgi:Protein of unknown function (DUF3108)
VAKRSFGTGQAGIICRRTTDRHRSPALRSRRGLGWLLAASLLWAGTQTHPADADDVVAVYEAYWAGLPAAEIRLNLSEDKAAYRGRIEITTEGLPALLSRFRATAVAEGRLGADQPAQPERYDAIYDLRKRHNSHISMLFTGRAGVSVAERGPGDTSHKPPLAEGFRRNAVDPLTAIERIRGALRGLKRRPEGSFAVPVFDGARRFDIIGRMLPEKDPGDGALRVELTLRPIAGFKGETSEDGDPDSAPRKVALTVTDDARLMPLSITVPVFYLPLVVRFDHLCTGVDACSGKANEGARG